MLGLLKRNIYYCNQNTKAIAYKYLVRPRLEYCSAIWDPQNESNKKKTGENPEQSSQIYS